MHLDELTYPVEVSYVSIDSRARNRDLYPDPCSYVISFERVFKDVVSVELVYALYAKAGDEDYVCLVVDELMPNMLSHMTTGLSSFTQLPLRKPHNEYTRQLFRSIRVFPTPLNKLSRFTLRFASFAGTPYPIREHLLRFEITCLRFQHPTNKDLILTRDVVHAWKSVGLVNATPETGNAAQDTGYATRDAVAVPTEGACRRLLGLPPRPAVVRSVQDVVDAFRVRSRTLRADGGTEADHDALKRAFGIMARRVASRNVDHSRPQ
jgi:hypothetical protein